MSRKLVLTTTLMAVLIGMLGFSLDVRMVEASGTIYIRVDGSIDPPTAPISTVDNVTYTLTDNVASDTGGIVVERDNIVVDGAGFTLQATWGWGKGIDLFLRSNVTIQNMTIKAFLYGIYLDNSFSNSIVGNNITNNQHGISLSSSYNKIGHNNFINNTWQASSGWVNAWDDGYPSGGNYWSNYTGVDMNSGFYQNQTDSDGIGDMPHTIDANNIDNYPLMAPISFFDAGTWNDTAYYVNIVSNSTLSHFYFNPDEGAFVSLSVKGETVTEALGFCRVAIPKDLLWVEDGWTVLYGSYPLSYETFSDENCTYLYFTYTNPSSNGFTTLTINGTNVIPEFPSFLVLPLFMTATLLTVIVHRRKQADRR